MLHPFPPGTFEEYNISEDGRTTFVRQETFHKFEDRPGFKPFIPYDGK